MQDRACSVSAFCRFVSVIIYTITTLMVIALALAVSVWWILDIYILIPGKGSLVFANLLGIFGTAFGGLCIITVLYAAVLLWDKKEPQNRIYRIYQVASIVLAVLLLVLGIVLNVKGIIGLLQGFLYYPFLVGSPVLCGIAFGVKCKEKKQDTLRQKEDMTFDYPEENLRETVIAVMNEAAKTYGIRAIEGDYAGAVFEMKDGESLVFGTHPRYCHIIFQDPKISRTHCMVVCQEREKNYLITDCSKNGTFLLNGERLPFGVACAFPSGTIFSIRTNNQMFQLL